MADRRQDEDATMSKSSVSLHNGLVAMNAQEVQME